MMNRKGFGRKRLWPNLRYYPGIHLKRLRKTTKNLRVASLKVICCVQKMTQSQEIRTANGAWKGAKK